VALPFFFSFETYVITCQNLNNCIHHSNLLTNGLFNSSLIIQYSSSHALFIAYFCGFVLVRKFYCGKRNSQRYTAHSSSILALGDCFVDYPALFTGAYRTSKGFNSAELENSYIIGDPIRNQFQHVHIHGAKIIHSNKHCFDKLNDTNIYRIGFLDGFQRTDYVKASDWHRYFFDRLDVYYC
jgi:hypothetical protein